MQRRVTNQPSWQKNQTNRPNRLKRSENDAGRFDHRPLYCQFRDNLFICIISFAPSRFRSTTAVAQSAFDAKRNKRKTTRVFPVIYTAFWPRLDVTCLNGKTRTSRRPIDRFARTRPRRLTAAAAATPSLHVRSAAAAAAAQLNYW